MLLPAILVALAAPRPVRAAEPRLIPEPLSIQLTSGTLPLRGAVTIAVPSNDAEDLFAAALLEQEIEPATGADVRVTSAREGAIVLARDPGLAGAGEEGYRIEVTPARARVSARTAAGLFYGVQTLRQMVTAAGLPAATIDDRPALRWRGLHDDVSRGPVPTVEALERRIALAAEFKLNLYALYSEHAFEYRSHPLIAPAGGAFTAAELRRLGEFASRHHVALLFEQQVFGHLDRVLDFETYRGLAERPGGGSLAAASPAVDAFVDSLYREIAPLSTAPFLHLGGDEVVDPDPGRPAASGRGTGVRAYADRVRRMHDLLAPHGKRIMLWGDFAQAHPQVLSELPRDLVIASWDYTRRDDYTDRVAPIRAAGLDLFVCPGAHNWNRVFPNLDDALPNIQRLTLAGQKGGALGQLTCTWDDNGDALFGLCWYPVLYGAAAAWQSGACDPARFERAFDWALFRNPGEEAARAVARINAAHGLLRGLRPTDATLELSWLNPARSGLDRRLLAALAPIATPLRQGEEDAIALVGRARRGARRNADQLDYLDFAARRLHALGGRMQMARRLQELYAGALAHQAPADQARAVESLNAILGLLAQGREQSAVLRADYERLWLAENRPYWLANVLAQFDRDLEVWFAKADQVRVSGVMFRNGTPLPTAEQMGF